MNTIIFNDDGSIKDTAIASTAKTELSDAPGTYVLNGISTADGWPETYSGKCLLVISGTTQPLATNQVLFANGKVWYRLSASADWKDENNLSISDYSELAQLKNQIATWETKLASVKTELSKVYKYKGSVTDYASLPSTDVANGDVYNVVAANGIIPAGTNYAAIVDDEGAISWDALGGSVDLTFVEYAATQPADDDVPNNTVVFYPATDLLS